MHPSGRTPQTMSGRRCGGDRRPLEDPGSANCQSSEGERGKAGAVTKVTHTVARRFARGGPEPEPEEGVAVAASTAGRVRGVASCRVRFPEFPDCECPVRGRAGAVTGSAAMYWLSCRFQSWWRWDSGRWACRTQNAAL